MATCIATLNSSAFGGGIVPGPSAGTIETRYILHFFGEDVPGGLQSEAQSIETNLSDTAAKVRNAIASRISERAAAQGLTVIRPNMRFHGPDNL